MPLELVDNELIFYTHNASDSDLNFVLIHGSGGNHAHWPDDLRSFSGANVYGLDLPGHGQSGGTGCTAVDAYTDFIDAFVRKLDLDKVVLFGHSLGGAIAQLAALRHYTWLASVVLVGSGARLRVAPAILEGLLSDFRQTVDELCKWSLGPTASKALTDNIRKSFLKADPQTTYNDFSACDKFDVIAEIDRIACPTLIISGSADKLTPVKYGRFLTDRIPDARLLIIQEGGHMMALEKSTEFMAGVAAFCEDLL